MEQGKPLVITPENAKKLYSNPAEGFKAVLEDTFGKPFFSEKISDRVKTFEDACNVLDIDPDDVVHSADDADDQAYKKLKVIVRALNEGWEPNYNDTNQRKWYPWFYLNSPGFRLDDCDCVVAGTTVGARLVFKSEELARYAATQFTQLYRAYLEL